MPAVIVLSGLVLAIVGLYAALFYMAYVEDRDFKRSPDDDHSDKRD